VDNFLIACVCGIEIVLHLKHSYSVDGFALGVNVDTLHPVIHFD
jgi:hypothetical protein